MPTSAIKALATITLGSAQTTVTFSSISQAYRDLRVVISGKANFSSIMAISYNGDTTGGNYNWIWMQSNGASYSGGTGNDRKFGNSATDSGVMSYDIMDYSTTNKHKTGIGRTSFPDTETILVVQRWTSTAAINSVAFTASSTTWATGTTFTLYGVSA